MEVALAFFGPKWTQSRQGAKVRTVISWPPLWQGAALIQSMPVRRGASTDSP